MKNTIPSLTLSTGDVVSLETSTAILGGPGSGKSSAVGLAFLEALLIAGCGGLLLAAHREHVRDMLSLIAAAGRRGDVLLFSRQRFNFLEYARRAGYGLENIVALFSQATEAIGRLDANGDAGARGYWMAATRNLLRHTLATLLLAKEPHEPLTLTDLHRVIAEAPDKGDFSRASWRKSSSCYAMLEKARQRAARSGDALSHHHLGQVEAFWRSFEHLNDRTKTSIVNIVETITGPLLYGELYERSLGLTLTPELTHGGKLIVMDVPAEELGEGALYLQILMQSCWMLATRRRVLTPESPMTFEYADESALFLTSECVNFLGVCRGKRATVCYLMHSLPELTEKLGTQAAPALLGQCGTKVFLATGDPVTSRFAADLVGETWQPQETTSRATNLIQGGAYQWLWLLFIWKPSWVRFVSWFFSIQESESVSVTDRLAYQVLPAEFTALRTGGRRNVYEVDAILFQSGRVWTSSGANYARATFRQRFAASPPILSAYYHLNTSLLFLRRRNKTKTNNRHSHKAKTVRKIN